MSRDKKHPNVAHPSICGHYCENGKNFAVDDAVVGKIKRSLISSGSVLHVFEACHKCRINFK